MSTYRHFHLVSLRPACVAVVPLILAMLLGQGCKGADSAGRRRGRGEGAVPAVWAAAGQRDMPVQVEAIGNVEAYSMVSIKPQVSGQITEVHVHEGDDVRSGALLFSLDQRPLAAQLDQARANAARDTALLKQSEANLVRDRAQADYSQAEAVRYGHLLERGIVSKEQFDQMKAAADAASATANADQAAVASARAEEASAKAAVDTARLQLAYALIRSPLDGRTGNITVKAGNIVTANTTELTTVAQVQPIYVTFSVPAIHLANIKRYMGTGIQVLASPQDQASQPSTGRLTFVDNTVDSSTDTIKLKATFTNQDRRLWPGQFIRVVAQLTTVPNATVVPSEAVQTGQEGQFVFVVRPDSTVEQRTVTTGIRLGQEVVVTSGIKPGEQVVTEGQLRLEPGTHVVRARVGGAAAGTAGGKGTGQQPVPAGQRSPGSQQGTGRSRGGK